MTEEWRDIKGYEGLYQVSSFGRVRSLDRLSITSKKRQKLKGRYMKLSPGYASDERYLSVTLYKCGAHKKCGVHRLVAEAFIHNPDNLPQVNHKDENPSNNSVDNLEWCTAKYNMNYGTVLQRRSEKLKGRKRSMEDRIKISRGQTGRRYSDEAKLSMSVAAKLRCEYQRQAKLLGITYAEYKEMVVHGER